MYLGRLTAEQSGENDRHKSFVRVPEDGDWSIEWECMPGCDQPVECLCVYSECGFVYPPIPIDELKATLSECT